jgi:hypothetical protein
MYCKRGKLDFITITLSNMYCVFRRKMSKIIHCEKVCRLLKMSKLFISRETTRKGRRDSGEYFIPGSTLQLNLNLKGQQRACAIPQIELYATNTDFEIFFWCPRAAIRKK